MSNWSPHITVATVVESSEQPGHFLLVHEEDDGLMVYNQPAGHWDQGETLVEAALRETLEETGWRVELTGYLGCYSYTSPRNGVTYLRHAFAGKPVEQVHNELDNGIVAALWLDYDTLCAKREQMRSPMVIRLIEDYQTREPAPLELVAHIDTES